ncbi:TolC family protein [Verrucomicrobiales bacterium BCK34]|nr:TolC family protein [Verrucomicrobiales bacterium BCK34]
MVPVYDLRLAGSGQETYLELDEAIAAALRSNLEIQINAIDPQLEEDRTLQAIGEFDPAFESRFRYDNLDTPQSSQEFLGTGGDRFGQGRLLTRNRVFAEENLEAKAGIVGRLRTGAEYDVGTRTNRFINDLTNDPTVGRFDPEYRTFTGITFLQPLLQDFGREVNETKITVSHRNKEIADQVFRQRLSGIIKDVIDAYYDAFLAYEDAMVKRFEVEVLRRMAVEKRDQLERGAAREQDAAMIKSELSESYERFLLARQTLLTKNGDLLMLMQQEFEFECYPVFLPIDAPSTHHPDLNPHTLAKVALKNRPEYLMAVENAEKLGLVLKYRENQLLPRVDLEATIGYSGLSGSYGAAYEQSTDGQGHDYGIGIVVNVPLGNTEKKALYAETENQQRQALLQVKREELQTNILINRHITSIQTHEKRLHAAKMSTRIELDTLERTRESLEKGTISESTLMKVERDVSETRLRQFAAAADLQKSLADLWTANGTLLSRYGIDISDATTNEPAKATTRSVTHQNTPTDLTVISSSDSLPDTIEPAEVEPKTLENHLRNFFTKAEKKAPTIEKTETIVVAKPVAKAPGNTKTVEKKAAPELVASPVKRDGLSRFFKKTKD